MPRMLPRTLQFAKDFVIREVDLATGQGFTVSPTGEVAHPDAEKAEDADHIEHSIQSGLDEVDRLDTMYGTPLRDAAGDLAAMKEGQPDVTMPNGQRADPDEVVDLLGRMPSADERAAFLAGMNPDDVQALVTANPEAMGNMNGVPFDTRIDANEINVRNALTDELQKTEPDQSRVDQLQKMLTPIPDPLATRPAGASPTDFLVDRKFVMFSTEGNGRMIEMVGDIRPGIHGAGVIVPGTNTNLNGSSSNHDAAVELAKQSGSPIFLYMEGDFPQGLDKATDASYAADMAPKLVDFGHEIDRAIEHGAPGTKVTYIGHSYGGSIVGSAEQEGLRADRIVHASSAGTGIHSTEWHNPNPNVERFSMTAPGDPIGISQSTDRNVNLSGIPGIAAAEQWIPHTVDGNTGNPHGGHPLGGDPDEIPGVTRLDTGYYGSDDKGDAYDAGQIVFGPDGHGKYWDDPSSTAFQNMAGVISGGEVHGYVERGIEANNVDIDLGDTGNFEDEAFDFANAEAGKAVSGADILPGPLRLPEFGGYEDPYGNPTVTDRPELGPKIDVK
jgi:hypothetical protein